MILPYLEQRSLWEQFSPTARLGDPVNAAFRIGEIPSYLCPSDPKPQFFDLKEEGGSRVLARLPVSNYIGVFGTGDLHGCENSPGDAPVSPSGQCMGDGIFFHNSKVRIPDVTDGTSNTMMVGEHGLTRCGAGIRRGRA